MATWLSGISRQHRMLRKNTFVWCGIFLTIFILVFLKLFWLQAVQAGRLRGIADEYHRRKEVIPAMRGTICDRNNKPLALDDARLSLYVDPTIASDADPAFIARVLAPIIQEPEAKVLEACTRQSDSKWIKRDLTPTEADAVRRLGLAGVSVVEDGKRYRIGIDLAQLVRSEGLTKKVADLLHLPAEQVERDLGTLDPLGPDNEAARDRRFLQGEFDDTAREEITGLHLPGVLVEQTGVNYSVSADPRLFSGKTPQFDAQATARALAPALGLDAAAVQTILQTRTRFVWLKRGLDEGMTEAIGKLEGTLFITQPGKILESQGREDKPQERLEAAVVRLDKLLNAGVPAAEAISRDEIRRRLLPGAAAGPLVTRLYDGKPNAKVTFSLYADPIPGVFYGLPGIGLRKERRRRYPYGTLAAPMLGFVSYSQDQPAGAFGLEMVEQDTLGGVDGTETKEITAGGATIPETEKATPPVHGRDIILTIDQGIQVAAEEELKKACEEQHAAGGTVVVMDPKTGEILALASYPSWDANDPGASTVPLANPAVSNFYEPGSTFKVVAVTAALEDRLIHPGQTITVCARPGLRFGKRLVKEAHGFHGPVDAQRLLEQSCNIGAAKLALSMGPQRFLEWCDTFGFGKATKLGLPNESPGYLNRANASTQITLANMAFGQGLAVTPVQIAAAYSAIANGGEYIQPHLLLARQHASGEGTWDRVEPERHRVCSKATADLVLKYLVNVVTNGTGKRDAEIPGYLVAGKTGTAQRPGEHGYSDGGYIASFVGIMPADNPRFTIIAVIDRPQGSIYGGKVAGPVVREVGRRALQYAGVTPTMTESQSGSTVSPAKRPAAPTRPAAPRTPPPAVPPSNPEPRPETPAPVTPRN